MAAACDDLFYRASTWVSLGAVLPGAFAETDMLRSWCQIKLPSRQTSAAVSAK
jgi:hypothetical protein